MIARLYIVGPVGSGKSTLAKALSEQCGIPCFELDTVVHQTDVSLPNGNRKRSEEEIQRLFSGILEQKSWIIEDTGRIRFIEGLRRADSILLLEPRAIIRKFRIVHRWVRQNLQLESCSYRPGFSMLKAMFRWSKDYDSGRDGLKSRLAGYPEKAVVIRTKRELQEFIHTRLQGSD